MSVSPLKGMILCAGLGTRLKPITDKIPKPLVEVLTIPNINYVLYLFAKAGIKDVIVNLHHKPEPLENYLTKTKPFGMNIQFSKEPFLLGTGGGVKKAEWFLKGSTFVLANCDFITNIDLLPLIEDHFHKKALASMVLHKDDLRQHLYSKVGVDFNGHLCSLPKKQTKEPSLTGIFTGLHIINADVLSYLREEPCGINDILYPHLLEAHPDQVCGHFTKDSFWFDTGEIGGILQTQSELFRLLELGDPFLSELFELSGFKQFEVGIWAKQKSVLGKFKNISQPAMLGNLNSVGDNVYLGPNISVGDNSIIGENCHLSKITIQSKSKIPPNSKLIEPGIWFEEMLLRC